MSSKLTDNEIVKALECCLDISPAICKKCPLFNITNSTMVCSKIATKFALGLINRQKAENERLQATIDSFTDIGKLYSEIKAEAYKEFARLLRQQAFDRLYVSVDEINKLLKELVGENNAS